MYIKSCGINSIQSHNFRINRPDGFNTHLFLRTKTPARFYIEGRCYDTESNDIILYHKDYPQFYEERQITPYIDDYIFFDAETPQEEDFIRQLDLKFNQPLRLPLIHSFMSIHQLICMDYINPNEFYKEAADCLLRYFLIKLSHSMHSDSSILQDHFTFERFNELRLALYSSPAQKWTVQEMADFVNLSPSYFQNVYKKLFKISCIADLVTSRMNHAIELLSTTKLRITEIAEQCGYESHIYFSRHFKKKMGMTPSEYRANHPLPLPAPTPDSSPRPGRLLEHHT